MTATLRYDIGLQLAESIREYDRLHEGLDILSFFGARDVARWGGAGNPRRDCVTLALKLPNQIVPVWKVQETLHVVMEDAESWAARNSASVLYRKIGVSLGILPDVGMLKLERVFLDPIRHCPGDLATWSAYSDWLQDREETHLQQRGWVMAGWLGKKAMKIKYGVPMRDGRQIAY